MAVCNYDCLNCLHSDCIDPPLTMDEYERSQKDDLEISIQSGEKRRPRDVTREERLKYQREWHARHKEKDQLYQKAHRVKNKAILGRQEEIIKARSLRKWTQRECAKRLGVSPSTLCRWESGEMPATWDKLCWVMPELEKYRPKEKLLTGRQSTISSK